MLASGIGPAEELKAIGVDPKHDLAGVGKDLQDHLMVRMVFKTKIPGTLNEVSRNPLQSVKMAMEYAFKRSGQLTVGATEATLFAKSRPEEPVADLQFQCINFSTEGAFKVGLHAFPAFMFNFCVCRPHSKGEITLRDPGGRFPPRIKPNYMSHPEDWRMMLAGWRIGKQIADTPPFKSLITERHLPAPGIDTRRRVQGIPAQHGLDRLSPLRHQPHGHGCARRRRSLDHEGARPRRSARRRCLRHADGAVVQHSPGHHHGRGEVVRHDRSGFAG